MKGVAELMEERCHLVPGEQRRLSLGGLGIVANVEDEGYLFPEVALLGKRAHPCATAFGGTTEVVVVEQGKCLAVFVDNLVHLHVGMIDGNVVPLLKLKSVDAMGGIEDTVDQYAVDVEIGLDLFFGEVIGGLLHLGRIVEAVVGLKVEVGTFSLTGIGLDGLCLFVGLGSVLADELFQEGINLFGGLCHGLLKRQRGIVLVTHQFCLLSP